MPDHLVLMLIINFMYMYIQMYIHKTYDMRGYINIYKRIAAHVVDHRIYSNFDSVLHSSQIYVHAMLVSLYICHVQAYCTYFKHVGSSDKSHQQGRWSRRAGVVRAPQNKGTTVHMTSLRLHMY